MSLLLALSNELIYKIIDHIHPDDIVNFSLIRKEVHVLAKDAVSLHRERKKTYGRIFLDGCYRHKGHAHPLQVISHMCMDWRIGEYTKLVRVHCCPERSDDGFQADHTVERTKKWEADKAEDDAFVRSTMQRIQEFVQERAKRSGAFDVAALCDEVLITGRRDAMIALMLLFVSNLETICLDQFTRDVGSLGSFVNLVTEQSHERGPVARHPLKQLSQVHLLGNERNLKADDFGSSRSFIALPSMRTISGYYVGGDDPSEVKWNFPSRIANITDIILERSAIRAEYLTEMLVGIKALKRFTFDHRHGIIRDSSKEIHKVIRTLCEHSSESLEYLALTGIRDVTTADLGEHCKKGFLRGFKVLTEVCLGSEMYADEVVSKGSSSPNSCEGEYGCYRHIIRPLVDILPSSVDKVTINGWGVVENHVGGLLANLWQEKHLRLPKLNSITILMKHRKDRMHRDCVDRLTRVCAHVGVYLEIGSEGTRGRTSRPRRLALSPVD